MEMYRDRGRHLVTTVIEHPAVLDPARYLERTGCGLTVVGVDSSGVVDAEAVITALQEDTVLCSVMWANNEIGTIQPVEEIAKACSERGILFHTDAVQVVGKMPIAAAEAGIDLLSLTAHKFHGPMGVGALMVRRQHPRVRLAPLFHGGGHQKGLRSGTPPVPLIVGLGEACALAAAEMETEAVRVRGLRDRLLQRLQAALPDLHLNGDAARRLAGNANLSFHGVEAEALLLEMQGVALSTGSACSSAEHEPSHVLLALGASAEEAHASLRISVGRFNTEAEIDTACRAIIDLVERFHQGAPLHRAVGGEQG
jgi:cysteine desulfurase